MALKDHPVSFRDPVYASLDASVEEKLKLPAGMLSGIREKGERSNADQVSEAGARTVYQITPQTRKLAMNKWGVDPYLTPENAAEVAGLLLKDSLQRNKGDAAAAVGEYHGGTDRKNWGPRTRAYIERVTAGAPAAQVPEAALIARAYEAYRAGRMDPQAAAEFEQDVGSGLVQLPLGASLKRQPEAPFQIPASALQAYASGAMDPESAAQLEADVKADPSLLAPGAKLPPRGSAASQIPGESRQAPAAEAPVSTAEPTLLDRARGAVEAGLALATGATGGTLGAIGGTLGATAASIASGQFGTPEANDLVRQAAAEGAQALTRTPRTAQGVAQTQAAGEVLSQLPPVIPLAPELGAAARLASAGLRGARAGVAARAGVEGAARAIGGEAAAAGAARAMEAAPRIAAKATTLPRRALEAIKRPAEAPQAAPGTRASVGAAGTTAPELQRRALAQGLPAPVELTKGQATRDPAQLKFEVETAKQPELGAPLRQRYVQQNEAILRNFDAWADQTGAEAPTPRAVGLAVDKALVDQMKRDKTQVNAAYAAAKRSPEASAVVDLSAPVLLGEGDGAITGTPLGYLNEQPVSLPSTALTDAARQYAVRLGVAEIRDGQLVPLRATIRQMEDWRKAINQATGYEPADIRHATILKGLIDGQTEPVAGPLYRQARATRARFAQNYEDRAVISKLLANKRGTADRAVALEDVFDHAVLRGSLDDVRNVRRVLQRSGAEGQQAWRELQGSTVAWIRDQATKGISTDAAGNRVLSPAALDKAIRGLDVDGRLEFIFGKQGAQRMRDINELAQIAKTVPPEAAINTSNTAATLLTSFGDIGLSGVTGIPAPIGTAARLTLKHVKDRALRKRIAEALQPQKD